MQQEGEGGRSRSPASICRHPSTKYLTFPSSTAEGQTGQHTVTVGRKKEKGEERQIDCWQHGHAADLVHRVGGAGTGSGQFTNLLPSASVKEKKTTRKRKDFMQVTRPSWACLNFPLLNMTVPMNECPFLYFGPTIKTSHAIHIDFHSNP